MPSRSNSIQSGRKQHPVWNYSRLPIHPEPEKDEKKRRIAYCSSCNYHTSVVTNFRVHLENAHKIFAERKSNVTSSNTDLIVEKIEQLLNNIETEEEKNEIRKKLSLKLLPREEITEKLVKLIVVRTLPFSAVNWPELQEVINMGSSSEISLPVRQTITKKTHELYQEKKDVVRQRLQSAISSVHISLDIWTSPNRLLFLATCGHFIDREEEKARRLLLNLSCVSGHSGDNQFEILKPVLEDFGIVRKLGVIIGDNSGTNDTLCRAVERYLGERRITWEKSTRRLRCVGHIINLIAQAFLFKDYIQQEQLQLYEEAELQAVGEEVSDEANKRRTAFRKLGALGKLHNIVVYLRASPHRTKEFEALADRMIPLDNATRWNSWYSMIDVALKKEFEIDKYAKENVSIP